jgi:protein-arginine kinase activator protein McsA
MIDQPSEKEEEYFKLQELKKIKKMREEAAGELAVKEKERLKELHWLRCPKCGLELDEVEYRGVIVDACYSCGGMFLDQGEIDKIVAFEKKGDKVNFSRFVGGLFGGGSE